MQSKGAILVSMKKQHLSKVSIIVTIIAIVALTTLLINAKHRMAAPVATAPAAQPSQSVCYYLNQPSKGGMGNDIAYVKMTVDSQSQKVVGELTTELAEKDKLTGTLSGTIAPSTTQGQYIFDGQYANSGEGMNSITEQLIRFDTTKAEIGYGGTYSLSIPRVDCSRYDSLKMVMQD